MIRNVIEISNLAIDKRFHFHTRSCNYQESLRVKWTRELTNGKDSLSASDIIRHGSTLR